MKQKSLHNSRKILLRATNWIGDAVMTTPALAAVRASFPQAEIIMLANPLVAQLFQHHPAVDKVMVYDRKGRHKGWRGFMAGINEVQSQHFDLAILFQNAIEAALLTFAARVPARAGYATDARGFLLTHPVKISAADKQLHHTRYYLTMLERLGISGGDGKLSLNLTTAEQDWASSVLKTQNVIAVNPGAAYGSAKRWFPERFAQVADTLAQKYQSTIVLTGGPAEIEIGQDIQAFMQQDCMNLIGTTSVRQMMAVLASSRMLITNDSGPMHVAAAFDVPIVAIFGPTDHTTTSPASTRVKIVRKDMDCAPCLLRQCPTDHRCMKAITPDDVISAAVELLNEADEGSDS